MSTRSGWCLANDHTGCQYQHCTCDQNGCTCAATKTPPWTKPPLKAAPLDEKENDDD